MKTPYNILSAALDKAASANSNKKWITIHPNDAEEGKGRHVQINTSTGEIEKGNPHLLAALKDRGAKVAPEAVVAETTTPTSNGAVGSGTSGNESDDFTAPIDNDFNGLFEDEEPKAENPVFTDHQKELFAMSHASSDAEIEAWKAYIDEHPDSFKESAFGGIGFAGTAEEYKAVEAEIKAQSENDETEQFEFAPPEDDEFKDLADSFEAPDDADFAGIFEEEQQGAQGKSDETNGDHVFTDDEINTINKANLDIGWADYWISKFTSALTDGCVLNKKIAEEMIEDLKGKIEESLYNKVSSVFGFGPSPEQPEPDHKFTEEQINKYADGEWGDHFGEDYSEYAKKVVLAHPELFKVYYGQIQPKSISAAYEVEQEIENAKYGLPPYDKAKEADEKALVNSNGGGDVTVHAPDGEELMDAAIKEILESDFGKAHPSMTEETLGNVLKPYAIGKKVIPKSILNQIYDILGQDNDFVKLMAQKFDEANGGDFLKEKDSQSAANNAAQNAAQNNGSVVTDPQQLSKIDDLVQNVIGSHPDDEINEDALKTVLAAHPELTKTDADGNLEMATDDELEQALYMADHSGFTKEQIDAIAKVMYKNKKGQINYTSLKKVKSLINDILSKESEPGYFGESVTNIFGHDSALAKAMKALKDEGEIDESMKSEKFTNLSIRLYAFKLAGSLGLNVIGRKAIAQAILDNPDLFQYVGQYGNDIQPVNADALEKVVNIAKEAMAKNPGYIFTGELGFGSKTAKPKKAKKTTLNPPQNPPQNPTPNPNPNTPQMVNQHTGTPTGNAIPPPPPAQSVTPELTEGGYPFPADVEALKGLTAIKPLGGASGAHATLYQDANGNKFVMKRFSPTNKAGQQRLREECEADAYYLAGGANVPHFKLYGDEQSGYVKLSQYIPGTQTLGSVWHSATDEMKAKIKDGLRKNFALDVMAGAWDVLGTGKDNILVDKEGNVYRCDNGCAFNRRAQGDEKSEAAWGNGHIDDLWTMRGMAPGLDGKKIPDGTGKGDFFGDISTHQLLSDIVSRDWSKMIAHLPESTRKVMEQRIAHAKEYHAVCDNVVTAGMYGDGKHSEDVTLSYHCLNKFGAMEGCKNDISEGNYGYCRGNGGGQNPKPKLSDFFTEKQPQISDFTNAPEPKVDDFMPSVNGNDVKQILIAAAKSINFHVATTDKDGKPNAHLDGKPNMATVKAALALKPHLEIVANSNSPTATNAQEMLKFINNIENMMAGAKGGVWPSISDKLYAPNESDVDFSIYEVKEAAQKKFTVAHADWDNKTKNAQTEFSKAEVEWNKNKAEAEKKLAVAVNDWKKKTGGKGFGFSNLTECYDQFCKTNGIDPALFAEMAAGQSGSSKNLGAAKFKYLEIIAMGAKLPTAIPDFSQYTNSVEKEKAQKKFISDFATQIMGCSPHNLIANSGSVTGKVINKLMALEEFATNPKELEKYQKAYNVMKSLTMMLLRHSNIKGMKFIPPGSIRVCRLESGHDLDNYGVKKGEPCVYPMGAHESCGSFHTWGLSGQDTAVMFDLPISRISSVFFMRRPGSQHTDMYLGDGENEFAFNGIGIPRVRIKKCGSYTDISTMWDAMDAALNKAKGKVVNLCEKN